MDDFDWSHERTVAELRVRYGALRSSTDAECATMILAAAAQVAHRDNVHPAAVLHRMAVGVSTLWNAKWDEYIHEMLEVDVE